MASHEAGHEHDSIDSDPGPMYKKEWVQKLIRQIQQCLQTNRDWLGLDPAQPQRVLDYACGNGTVSSALLNAFPNTVFQGLDIATSQVKRYNDEGSRLLGEPHDRMLAIQGDLNNPQAPLTQAEWLNFDAAIISMALHHVRDPIQLLARLHQRIRTGGSLIVIDWLQHAPEPETSRTGSEVERKYVADDMTRLSEGPKIWPGFSMEDIHADMKAAGCSDIEVIEHPEQIDAPKELQGYNRMFIAKAKVL